MDRPENATDMIPQSTHILDRRHQNPAAFSSLLFFYSLNSKKLPCHLYAPRTAYPQQPSAQGSMWEYLTASSHLTVKQSSAGAPTSAVTPYAPGQHVHYGKLISLCQTCRWKCSNAYSIRLLLKSSFFSLLSHTLIYRSVE